MQSHHSSIVDIAPSILSADFSRLGDQISVVERAGASLLHVDVMDGQFVPNITVGLPVVKAISRATRLPIDAHLMIVEPGRYAARRERIGGPCAGRSGADDRDMVRGGVRHSACVLHYRHD